jgi:two-component system, NtrC family, sensor kinase
MLMRDPPAPSAPGAAAVAAAPDEAGDGHRRTGFWPLWAAALLLPLLAFAGGAWWSWQDVMDHTRERLVRTVDMLHEHALRAFEAQEGLLAAAELRARGMSWADIAADRELHGFLRGLDARTPGLGGIGLAAPDGRLAAASVAPFPAPTLDLMPREDIAAHRGGPDRPRSGVVGRPIASHLTGRTILPHARPRLDGHGRPDGGVVYATFAAGFFEDFYARLAAAPGDTVALLRVADGALLARHPPVGAQATVTLPEDAPGRRAIAASVAGGRASPPAPPQSMGCRGCSRRGG